jgi:F0F1-type ATP synthase assembly protein I
VSGLRGIRPPKPPSGERRRQAKAYEGAFEAVIAVVIATGIGYWADQHLDSSPIGLFVGVVLGFLAMVLRLLRLGSQLGITDGADASAASDEANESNDPDESKRSD